MRGLALTLALLAAATPASPPNPGPDSGPNSRPDSRPEPKPAPKPASELKPEPAATASSRFLGELPVMAGLWESGSGFLFPMTPGGRLAETRLLGRASEAQVRTFYAQALPRLGWRPQPGSPYAFRRGRERMVLHVAPHRAGGGVLTEALFVVTPQGGPQAGPAPAPRPSKDRR